MDAILKVSPIVRFWCGWAEDKRRGYDAQQK